MHAGAGEQGVQAARPFMHAGWQKSQRRDRQRVRARGSEGAGRAANSATGLGGQWWTRIPAVDEAGGEKLEVGRGGEDGQARTAASFFEFWAGRRDLVVALQLQKIRQVPRHLEKFRLIGGGQ